MRRIRSGCCARTASGNAAAEPASTLMNSRRLIAFPMAGTRHRTGSTYSLEGLGVSRPMSALGHKRTCAVQETMSAKGQKQTSLALFDHLIGSRKQFVWDGESERLGSLEIDDQLILCRHLHWEIGRLLALEDAVDISCR
jgi:hypothetical protein